MCPESWIYCEHVAVEVWYNAAIAYFGPFKATVGSNLATSAVQVANAVACIAGIFIVVEL